MIFYIAVDENNHAHWVGTQADARAIDKNFTQFDVPTDKTGLLAFLNEKQAELNVLRDAEQYDGEQVTVDDHTVGCRDLPAVNYAQQSIDLDDAFENLSLARQLHFAGMALENARAKLPG